jgi:phosphatidylserine/phosphatidylglycerophosphate/cardiolipin synthase-like enzyme
MGRYASAYFSPDRGADLVVIGFIDHCHSKLDIAVYSLTHDPIAEAIIRAHERGVVVRALVDSTQAGNQYADDERLEAAGVTVRRDIVTGSMHNKFLIGDSREGGKAVLTGSYNFTKNATERNAENFVVLRLQYIAADYQAEFDRLWAANDPGT